jgi:hypothetical protein
MIRTGRSFFTSMKRSFASDSGQQGYILHTNPSQRCNVRKFTLLEESNSGELLRRRNVCATDTILDYPLAESE